MAEYTSVLKEGYLIKKGHNQKTWKTRWFVLKEDRLSYFRQKDKSFTVGFIKLRGCSILFPVPDYVKKRKDVFKLTTHNGREYLMQASNEEERENWIHTLSAVIRSLDSTLQCCYVGKSVRRTDRQTYGQCDLSDMLGAMQDQDAGVTMMTVTVDDTEYKNCFSGSEVIDWLLRWMFAQTREQAQDISSLLLQLAHIQPLSSTPDDNHRDIMVDSNDAFYRFSTLKRSPSREMLFDSSSDSSSSLGEESEGDVLDDSPVGRGRIVKEGFLMKRGHLRKRWKVRKVILKDNPPSLEYYSAAKDCKDMLKLIDLEDAQAVAVEDDNKNDRFLNIGHKRPKHMFCVKLKQGGKPLMFQADNVHVMKEWLTAFSELSTCTSSSKDN